MSDLVWLDATELARLIRAREVSPVEVLRTHRERAGAVNPKINAIVTPMEEAEELARAAEAAVRRGDELGPLHGVPFTIKDSFDTAGVRTTRGSRLFADHIPAEDAVAVARLRDAGAIPRERRRRLDSLAGALLRHRRAEADARPRAAHRALAGDAPSLHACRADGADGSRRGARTPSARRA